MLDVFGYSRKGKEIREKSDKYYIVTFELPYTDLIRRIPASIRGLFKLRSCTCVYRNGDIYPVTNEALSSLLLV